MDSQEARTYALILIVCLTLGIIIIYFIVSILRQQRRTLRIQRSVVLAELTAIEKERARIATDLHDDISPVLSVVKFQVDNTGTISSEDEEQLLSASKYIDEVLARLREISSNLMPSSLLRKGLPAAISEYIRKVEETGKLKVHFAYDDQLCIPVEYYANIYRIVQEVVHNIVKHARATAVTIRIAKSGKAATVFIRDNGQGFNYDVALTSSSGLGLRSLKNRAEVMDGRVVVQSEPGRGTAFLFTIPLKDRN